MGLNELVFLGGTGKVICRANMTDVTISVYWLSSGFLAGVKAAAEDLPFSDWGVPSSDSWRSKGKYVAETGRPVVTGAILFQVLSFALVVGKGIPTAPARR